MSGNAPDDIQNLVTCQDCGRQVPEGNMMMHHLRACVARARRPGGGSGGGCGADEHEVDSNHHHNDTQPMEVDDHKVSPESTGMATRSSVHGDIAVTVNDDNNDEVQVMEHSPRKSCPSSPARLTRTRSEDDALLATPQGGMRRRRQRVASVVASGTATQVPEVVDLVNGDSPSPHDSRGPIGSENQWACPQCTLLNPKSAARCDACHFANPVRPPDSTRTERLVHDSTIDESPYMSHLAFVSGGALMGGLLGAAGSFLHGRDPLSSMAEGAMSGVMGGALLNEVISSNRRSTRSSTSVAETGVVANHVGMMDELFSNGLADFDLSEQRQPISVAQARSSASISGGYPSLVESSESRNQRSRPRSSFRVVQEQGQDGTMTTIVMGGTSTTRIRGSQRGAPPDINDPMLSLLVHSYLEQQGHRSGRAGGADFDTMGYEDLLQTFGDGTENLGASEAQILSLPTKVIENPAKELPDEARQCLICLEDIGAGESRKILPCLHGFHSSCCDKWLRTNGSCPICKHRIG